MHKGIDDRKAKQYNKSKRTEPPLEITKEAICTRPKKDNQYPMTTLEATSSNGKNSNLQ
jgi:hypothetical protein